MDGVMVFYVHSDTSGWKQSFMRLLHPQLAFINLQNMNSSARLNLFILLTQSNPSMVIQR